MHKLLLPRGIRNRNPGNIRLSRSRWQGQKPEQHDADFVEFESEIWGLRALMRLLLTYFRRHDLDTVQSIINRYAPPHENPTDHYAGHVARRLGVRRTDVINLEDRDVLILLAQAIVRHENGTPPDDRPIYWYPAHLYNKAARMALGHTTTGV